MRSKNSLRIRPTKSVSRWEVLNKPIVIWFLSSVALSAVSFSYGAVQTYRQARIQRDRAIDKVKSQIRIRFMFAFGTLTPYPDHGTIENRKKLLTTALDRLVEGSPSTNLFPEYNNASILGLINEYERLKGPNAITKRLEENFSSLSLSHIQLSAAIADGDFVSLEGQTSRDLESVMHIFAEGSLDL